MVVQGQFGLFHSNELFNCEGSKGASESSEQILLTSEAGAKGYALSAGITHARCEKLINECGLPVEEYPPYASI